MTLKECLNNMIGQKVRIGAYSAYLYFGIVNDQMFKDLIKIDPKCMDCKVTDIRKSEFYDDIIIIYDSFTHGRFWFESEFLKAVERGELFVKKGESKKS